MALWNLVVLILIFGGGDVLFATNLGVFVSFRLAYSG